MSWWTCCAGLFSMCGRRSDKPERGDLFSTLPAPCRVRQDRATCAPDAPRHSAFFALVTRAFMLLGMVEFFKREDDASAAA